MINRQLTSLEIDRPSSPVRDTEGLTRSRKACPRRFPPRQAAESIPWDVPATKMLAGADPGGREGPPGRRAGPHRAASCAVGPRGGVVSPTVATSARQHE